MKTKSHLALVMLLATLLASAMFGAPKDAAMKKVTLEIDGLICSACVDTVEGALRAVKGVEEADVSLNTSEAVISFDSSKCKVADLIEALRNAQGMSLYDARVKEEKKGN